MSAYKCLSVSGGFNFVLLQQVGNGRPATAVGAEPPAVHEKIAVVRPEAVERLAGEKPSVAPVRRLVELLAPVAAVRLAFREGTAKGGEVAEGEKRFHGLARGVVCWQYDARMGRVHVVVAVDGAALCRRRP